jgi:hypothetical protein
VDGPRSDEAIFVGRNIRTVTASGAEVADEQQRKQCNGDRDEDRSMCSSLRHSISPVVLASSLFGRHAGGLSSGIATFDGGGMTPFGCRSIAVLCC